MMNDVKQFLQELLNDGVELWAEGDHLRFHAPQDDLTVERLKALSRYEDEIVKHLPTFSFEAPISYGQEALLIGYEKSLHKWIWNIGLLLSIQNSVDQKRLTHILYKLAHRHQALRTTISIKDGVPVQVIHATPTISFEEIDCMGQSWEQVREAVDQVFYRPFDLSTGPLWRTALVHQSSVSQALFIGFHHTIMDGWSLWAFADELMTLYAAGTIDGSELPPIQATYPQFVRWQREMIDAEGERLQAYWTDTLKGELPVLDLPTDYPRPNAMTAQTNLMPLHIKSDLRDQLRVLARREGVSFYNVLLAAFHLLLAQYQPNASRTLIGLPTAGRDLDHFARTLGYFVNPVVVDATFENVSFTTFLKQIQTKLLGAIEHRTYPFHLVVQALEQTERILNHGLIFQAMLIVQRPQNLSDEAVRLLRGEQIQLICANEYPNLCIDLIGWMQTIGEVDVTIDLVEQIAPNGLAGHILYKKDIFDEATIARIASHFVVLLERIVNQPEQSIQQFPILTDREYHQIVHQWNDTAVDFGKPQTIHALFEQQVERTPGAIALVFGDEQLTYAELNARANQLAHYLIELRAENHPTINVVAIAIERSIEMIVGILGVLKAGAAYLPIDMAYPPSRIQHMIQDSQATAVLTKSTNRSDLVFGNVKQIHLDTIMFVGQPTTNLTIGNNVNSAAYLIYTSGSTGTPKGVVMPHYALWNLFQWQKKELPQPARTIQLSAVGFDVACQELFTCWHSGGTLFLIEEEMRRDLPALLRFLEDAEIERMFMPYVMLNALSEQAFAVDFSSTSLRDIITAGEQLILTPAITGLMEKHPEAILHNHYGPTETHAVTSYSLRKSSQFGQPRVPIGCPIDNVKTYILNSEHHPMPIGIAGELYIGGTQLAWGYLNRPDLTAERFIEHPELGRLYKTGDLCRWLPDGNIEFLGRADFQVKIRGFRIELGEVENVLLTQDGVREAVVLAREEEGEKRLVAYIVDSGQLTVDNEEEAHATLRQALAQQLPEYMIPSIFVSLDALPLTPNGKVDRNALPVPESQVASSDHYVDPCTPTEKILANIWSSVLRVEQIGILDNFFALGGHSLLVTQVISRIATEFALNLPVQAVFEHPTIAQLAERIEDDQLVLALQSRADRTVSTPSETAQELEEEEFML